MKLFFEDKVVTGHSRFDLFIGLISDDEEIENECIIDTVERWEERIKDKYGIIICAEGGDDYDCADSFIERLEASGLARIEYEYVCIGG